MADKKKKDKKGGIGIFKLLLLLVVLVVAAVAAWGLTLPKDYEFERDVVIDADKDEVHAWVGDLKQWDNWGPWREEDPTLEYTYSETTTNQGDKVQWTGDKGSGSLTFTEVDPETGIEYSFQWEDWDPTPGAVRYEETDDGKVRVTWSMESKDTPFITRYFMTLGEGQMLDMFDKGLANLKKKVEAGEPEA